MKLLLTFSFIFACSLLSSQHILDIGVNDEYEGFDFLQESPDTARVYLSGENHQFKDFNELLEEKLLRYLHKERGVRYWINEMGASRSYLVNRAIQENDTTYLELLRPFSWAQDMEQYERIMAWNDSLPKTEKIVFAGVDVDHDFTAVVIALDFLLERDVTLAHDSIRLYVESLKGHARELRKERGSVRVDYFDWNRSRWSGQDVIESNLRFFMENVRSHKAFYKSFLGESHSDFEKITDCLEATFTYHKHDDNMLMHGHIFREEYMAGQVDNMLAADPAAKAFGQFGRCHISEAETDPNCERGVITSLAGRLIRQGKTELDGKVVTMACIYPEYEGGAWMNPLFKAALELQKSIDKDAVVAMSEKALPDSLVSEAEYAHDFYILNPEPYYESGYGNDGFSDWESATGRPAVHIIFGYNHQFTSKQIGIVAPYLSSLGFDLNDNHQRQFSIGIGGYSYLDGYNMFWYEGYWGKGRSLETDTSEVRLSMNTIRWESGGDLLWDAEHFNITPWTSIGVTQWSVSYETDVPVDNPSIPITTTRSNFNVSNTSFQLGMGLDVQYEWNWGVLGVKGAGFLDPGKGRWRIRQINETPYNAPDAPAIKHTYWSVGVYAGFAF